MSSFYSSKNLVPNYERHWSRLFHYSEIGLPTSIQFSLSHVHLIKHWIPSFKLTSLLPLFILSCLFFLARQILPIAWVNIWCCFSSNILWCTSSMYFLLGRCSLSISKTASRPIIIKHRENFERPFIENLTAASDCVKYRSQSSRLSTANFARISARVLWNLSTFTLFWGSYGKVVTYFIFSFSRVSLINPFTFSGPLSVTSCTAASHWGNTSLS